MSGSGGPPIRRLLGFAVARLGWAPETFWRATPNELYAALEALNGEDRLQSFAAFKRGLEAPGASEGEA